MVDFRKNSRKALAAGLSVWLSGVVFLFFCYLPMAVSATEHCPLAKPASSHCDKRSKANKNTQLVAGDSSQTLACCGFMPAVFDKTRKIEREIHESQPASRPLLVHHLVIPVGPRSSTTEFYSSFNSVQNKIFIKHQVFRI